MATTKVHITLDEELLALLDRLAEEERRTRSGMVQELIRRSGKQTVSPAVRDEIKRRAMAAVLSTDDPVSGEVEFSDVDSYRRWRERLWAGTPRYGEVPS